MNINKQIKTPAEATQYAIDWQNWQSDQDLSIGEHLDWQVVFHNLAIKFDLQDEFKENGII